MGIVASNLIKEYGKRPVVDHVSLEVFQGEVVGLLGPNGAGKTTTFAMIVGLVKTDGGSIHVGDQEVTELPMYLRSHLGVGYLPQEPSVFRKLTVEQNIRAVLEFQNLTATRQIDRLEDLLCEFRLQEVRKQFGHQLSGGERRRTEIARALAADPSFLLLDEPFAGVDPIAVAEIQEIVGSLKERNLGILITDHNVRETLRITDRAYIMHEGKILVAGSAQEVADNNLAREHYLGAKFIL